MNFRIRLTVSIFALLIIACGKNGTHRADIHNAVPPDTSQMVETQNPQHSTAVREASSPFSARVRYTLSYPARRGKNLYLHYCAVCHGTAGKGDGFNAWNLQPRPRDLTDAKYMGALSDARISETIREGGMGVRKSPGMPAWGNTFTDRQVNEIVRYIRTLSADSTNTPQ